MAHKNTGKMRNDFPAVQSSTTRDLEWAAGFLEGEGCFTKHGEVKAAQVNIEPLVRLRQLFGGHLKFHFAPKPTQSPYWIWHTSGSRGRGIALTLYSLMSTRRRGQIEQCLKQI